ncbi:MAG TPA: DUF4340 domain-containing protein [Pirellulales bacterium]|nr:DUF4340 domain-containing protein [Pirellulales bacterium]
MNEMIKTVGFVAAAVVAVAVGVWTHLGPAETDESKRQLVGKSLFADLKPESAKSLEIIEYDPDTATLKPFKVAEQNGLWRIPSHHDYPADASQQLGEAAAALVGCETINIETDDPSMHVTYGVVDPDPKSLASGTTGVGKRVTMEDPSGKKLAQIIIGKPVKGQTDLYYVRIPGQDPVYVVKLKTDKFSTKFEDWIEKDLLKLNAWDIERVAFNDYSIDELRRGIDPRSKIDVRYDAKDSKWKLQELEVFNLESREYEPQTLTDDEELNSTKLNDLKTALDDLKIVDVRPKPEGLAADLRAGEGLATNEEAQESLLVAGFRVASIGGGPQEIVSNEGEVICGTKEGVQYTLRFGRIAGGGEKGGDEEPAEESDEDKADDKGKGPGANRYIMVTAQFNEDLLTKPELEELPGEAPAKEEAAPEGKEEPKEDAEKTSAIESVLNDAAGLLALADEESEAVNEEAEKPAKPKAEKKPPKSDKAKPETKNPVLAKPKTPAELARERVTKENERKEKEYKDKVKQGEEKAKELSGRFANWYYIVSDSTYQKIHLGRDDIIKKKAPSADETKKDEHEGHEGEENLLKEEDKKLPE